MESSILLICVDVNMTKIALYRGKDFYYNKTINHAEDESFINDIFVDQIAYRRDAVLYALRRDSVNLKDIKFVVAEGGLLEPCSSGVYAINKIMIEDLIDGVGGNDVINLAGLVAFGVANMLGIKSLAVDPVSVDERSEVAKFAVHPLLRKKSLFHAMINKYLTQKYADSVKKSYEDLNIIMCHAGSRSVSVAAHDHGKVVDVNQAFMGFGPFGLSDSGTIPSANIAELCFKKHFTEQEIKNLFSSGAGFNYYLQTSSVDEISHLLNNGNKKAKQIVDACAYQISKDIVSHYVTLNSHIDVIILSGKFFSVNRFFKYISKRIETMAPVVVFDKEYEMEALIFNALKAINGEMEIINYV